MIGRFDWSFCEQAIVETCPVRHGISTNDSVEYLKHRLPVEIGYGDAQGGGEDNRQVPPEGFEQSEDFGVGFLSYFRQVIGQAYGPEQADYKPWQGSHESVHFAIEDVLVEMRLDDVAYPRVDGGVDYRVLDELFGFNGYVVQHCLLYRVLG